MATLKGKVALIYDNGVFTELAVTLAKDFGRVLYYVPWTSALPKSNERMIGQGIDNVERVDSPWSHYDEVDIWIFSDVYESELQQWLVNQGKRVWGCRGAAELELDRPLSKEKCKKLGIDIGPYKVLTGVDALRRHLKANDDQWVKISHTRGDAETFGSPTYEHAEVRIDELEHNLGAYKKVIEFTVEQGIPDAVEVGYDGFTIDGRYPKAAMTGVEVKDEAYIMKTLRWAELPEQVRSVNEKLAPALNRYGYRGFLSTEVRCTDDGKAYLIDPCFAEDTEILTDSGWKRFQDLDRSEKVATLNVETRAVEYQRPTDYIASRFVGDMVMISNKNKGIECLVTPNHGVWRTDRHGNGLYRERADSITDKGYIPRTGQWAGESVGVYTVPSYYSQWTSGRSAGVVKEHACDAVDIPMAAWLRFLAVYLGDGSIHSQWSVNVSQSDASANKEKVAEIVSALPFGVSRNSVGFVVNSVQLTEHLRDTGLCNKKRIPDFVKSLTPELIDVFLDAYRLCDGGEHKGQKLYFTTSKGLADDVQELVFKAGRLANIRKREVAGTTMTVGDKTYTRNHDTYVIGEVDKHDRFWFETGSRADRNFSRVPYDGMVYDVTVPNHTVYVRRNGKPFWSSNCCRAGAPPNELYQVMIENLADVIWYGAEGILIEPEFNAKWGAEVLLISDWADKNWMHVSFPEEVRENVKLRNFCVIEGEYYVIPQWTGCAEIGAVVALGDTPDAAIAEVKRICELVTGHNLDKPVDALDIAREQLDKVLGPDKKESAEHRRAREAHRAGKISDRQLDKVLARG